MTADVVVLESGPSSCAIRPDQGCAVTHYRSLVRGVTLDWFRPFDGGSATDVPAAAAGCYPLVPYSGRIARGILRWRDEVYRLPTGRLGDRHALHGTGWTHAWETICVTSRSAVFQHSYDGADWPFEFTARLHVELDDDGLSIKADVINTGTRDMPAGLGLHPIFCGPGLSLKADARTVWHVDDEKLFSRTSAVPEPWDFREGRPLAGTLLEHGFTDWDGVFELSWPKRSKRLRVTSDDTLRHLVVYTKEYGSRGEGFACVEPVSHSVDAFNLAHAGISHTGTRLLQPEASLSGRVDFRLIENL